MIGIGILTWRRAEFVRDVILPAITALTVEPYLLVISANSKEALAIDTEHAKLGSGRNLGPSGGKNRIFQWFKQHTELEHLFLFEDDTYPSRRGWDRWYRNAHQATKCEIITFKPEDFYQGITEYGPPCGDYQVVATKLDGAMMISMTRRASNVLGGMHRTFEGFVGGEDTELMLRSTRAKMCPFRNPTFVGCANWLDRIDYREWRGAEKRPDGDPAAHKIFGQARYEVGLQRAAAAGKALTIDKLYIDPYWDEETAKEV